MNTAVATARELGLTLREHRQRLGLTQGESAARAGVTRQWLNRLEGGHSTAEIGLVMSAAHALGLQIEIRPRPEQVPGDVDLDQVLAAVDRS